MAKNFLTNINLLQNEIQNAVLHKSAVAPANPVLFQIYGNSNDNIVYIFDGANWKNIMGELDGILTPQTSVIVNDNNDGTVTLTISDATQADSGLMSPADKTKLDSATSVNTADTLVLRDANGDIAVGDITAESITITSPSTSWTANSAVTKSYVEGLVSSGINLVDNIDCSTNPDYPAGDKGDAWNVTNSGRIGGDAGEIVNVGDLIVVVATTTVGGIEATNGVDFIIMESNRDQATDSIKGVVELATDVEAEAGTDALRVITPATLKSTLDANQDGNSHVAIIGDGVATSFNIAHSLNSKNLHVQVVYTSTGEHVITDVLVPDAGTVVVGFTNPPAVDEITAIILKVV